MTDDREPVTDDRERARIRSVVRFGSRLLGTRSADGHRGSRFWPLPRRRIPRPARLRWPIDPMAPTGCGFSARKSLDFEALVAKLAESGW